MRKRYLALIAVLFLFVGVASAAVGFTYSNTTEVSFGEEEFEQSAVEITDVAESGPGINVDEVDVTLENTDSNSDTSGTVNVYLMSGDTVEVGSSESVTVDAGETDTVTISVDQTPGPQYDSIDVQFVED